MLILTVVRVVNGSPSEVTATLQDGVWHCSDPEFLKVLEITQLPLGRYYPDRDLSMAELVAERYVGKVTDTRQKEIVDDPSVVY